MQLRSEARTTTTTRSQVVALTLPAIQSRELSSWKSTALNILLSFELHKNSINVKEHICGDHLSNALTGAVAIQSKPASSCMCPYAHVFILQFYVLHDNIPPIINLFKFVRMLKKPSFSDEK